MFLQGDVVNSGRSRISQRGNANLLLTKFPPKLHVSIAPPSPRSATGKDPYIACWKSCDYQSHPQETGKIQTKLSSPKIKYN